MTQHSDIDYEDIDDIDWEEAIHTLDAVEEARKRATPAAAVAAAAASSTSDQQPQPDLGQTSSSAHGLPETQQLGHNLDEDILLVYELLETSQDHLIIRDGDIEDLGMIQSFRPTQRTLFDVYRKRRGFLSVTDLTAPAGWCEVQYAYSLMGRRDLKPEDRPEKIITAAGNEIRVDKKIAVAHEKVLEKGRQVHKVLEREVHPEQILVQTDTKADRWGLRLLNQIVSLVTLRDTGKAREIPIFGFIEDVFVMGVIDEIEKRPLPRAEEPSTDSPSKMDSNAKITDFFKASSPVRKLPTHGYYLVDSKTRRLPSLPKKDYTVASRFQLMLYKYLFDVHGASALDWRRFWDHIRLGPDDALSDSFLDQTKAICLGSGLEALLDVKSVGGLAEYLQSLHDEIGILQDELELVYRWRGSSSSTPQKKRKVKTVSVPDHPDADADIVVQRAIEASLKGVEGTSNAPIDLDDPKTVEKPPRTPSPPRKSASDEAKSPLASTPMDVWELANRADLIRETTEGSIIGVEQFRFQYDGMLTYVKDAIAFWNGRKPRGVTLDETNKCRNCEYQDGCEWLAMKAEEHRTQAREKRLAREASTKTVIVHQM